MKEEPFPDAMLPALCNAVGHVVVNWAFVEHSLDTWSTIIFHFSEGKRLYRMMQKNLGRKLEFLRRCFKTLKPLQPYSAEALQMLASAECLSLTRHFVVHGVPMQLNQETGAAVFVKLDLIEEYTFHKINKLEIGVQELLDKGSECMDLTASMLKLSLRLLNAFIPEDQRDKLPRSIRG